MCVPRQLFFFQCGPEMPTGWTPLGLDLPSTGRMITKICSAVKTHGELFFTCIWLGTVLCPVLRIWDQVAYKSHYQELSLINFLLILCICLILTLICSLFLLTGFTYSNYTHLIWVLSIIWSHFLLLWYFPHLNTSTIYSMIHSPALYNIVRFISVWLLSKMLVLCSHSTE